MPNETAAAAARAAGRGSGRNDGIEPRVVRGEGEEGEEE
jgi:hypothetical protein